MKYIIKAILPLAALFFVGVSCERSEVTNEEETKAKALFVEITTPSFSSEGVVLTEYNKQTDQIVFSEDKLEYMVSNLTFDKLYTLTLSSAPELNAVLTVDCSTIGLEDINFEDTKMTVIKATDDMVWLWDSKELVGVVMQF